MMKEKISSLRFFLMQILKTVSDRIIFKFNYIVKIYLKFAIATNIINQKIQPDALGEKLVNEEVLTAWGFYLFRGW